MYTNDDTSSEELGTTLKELSDTLKEEEMFWRQKRRVLWWQEGDRKKISMR